jgi:hypothetical protein
MKIALFGDFAPTLGIVDASVRYELDPISLAIINLETPPVETLKRRPKAGPSLYGDEKITANFIGTKFVVNLANNHIMDYGETGLSDTIKICQDTGAEIGGAGKNLNEASKPIIKDIQGIKVGIICCAETQFGIATPWKSGVAAVRPWIYKVINELKSKVDIIIISIHGASEMSPWPSPQWQDLLRSFIDVGATIVHGHHSHVPQGFEEYHNGIIFYGLGNFLVDPDIWTSSKNTLWSIVPEIQVSKKGIEKWGPNTTVIEKNADGVVVVRKSNNQEYSLHKEYFSEVNVPLNDRELLTGLWQEVSIRLYSRYYANWLGFEQERGRLSVADIIPVTKAAISKILRRKNRDKDQFLLRYHLFACESHRNAIATALGVLGGEQDDLRTETTREIADRVMP